jgi:hypothetical protein
MNLKFSLTFIFNFKGQNYAIAIICLSFSGGVAGIFLVIQMGKKFKSNKRTEFTDSYFMTEFASGSSSGYKLLKNMHESDEIF